MCDNDGTPHKVWLWLANRTPIQRHVKVKGEANPYDPAYETYFEKREGDHMAETLRGTGHFAFSGIYSAGSASCVIRTSPGSRAGVSIIASPAGRVVPRAQITVFCFIPSATTGFTPKAFSFPNRVSLKEAFEGLEPDDGKLSRPVLRGLAPSNGGGLLGERPRVAAQLPRRYWDFRPGQLP